MALAGIPETIGADERWLIEYWAGHLKVTPDHLRQAMARVGGEVKRIRKYLADGYRICIRDQSGVLRKTMRIKFLADGIAASIPYHREKQGWLVRIPLDYSQRLFRVPFKETEQFTVSDTVKLSMHMTGFVQFSQGATKPIISGYNQTLKRPKGIGVRSDDPVNVTTGPLFGAILQGMEGFAQSMGGPCEVFEQSDFWHHPEFSKATDHSYNIEVFMLSTDYLDRSQFSNGNRTLDLELPFMSKFRFMHTLRILELPGMDFCLGVILSRMMFDDKIASGYKLSGPGCWDDQGKAWGIFAMYPRYDRVKDQPTTSLDYEPPPGLTTS